MRQPIDSCPTCQRPVMLDKVRRCDTCGVGGCKGCIAMHPVKRQRVCRRCIYQIS